MRTESPPEADPTRAGGTIPARALVGAGLAAVVAAVLLVVLFSGRAGTEPTAADDELATFAFLTTDGTTATLADFRGEPLVVNFFASWCAPCRAELPDIEAVHLANSDRVKVLGVNHDLDEATWLSFVEETEITFQTVFQPGTEIWTELDAKGMPSTALISPDGEVLVVHTGVLTDEALQALIDEHFGRA